MPVEITIEPSKDGTTAAVTAHLAVDLNWHEVLTTPLNKNSRAYIKTMATVAIKRRLSEMLGSVKDDVKLALAAAEAELLKGEDNV